MTAPRPQAEIDQIFVDLKDYSHAYVARKWGFSSAKTLSACLARWRRRLGIAPVPRRGNPHRAELLARSTTEPLADLAEEFGYASPASLRYSLSRWKDHARHQHVQSQDVQAPRELPPTP